MLTDLGGDAAKPGQLLGFGAVQGHIGRQSGADPVNVAMILPPIIPGAMLGSGRWDHNIRHRVAAQVLKVYNAIFGSARTHSPWL